MAAEFDADWRFSYGADTPRIGLMVSRNDDCLTDLLWRWQRGELRAVSVVVSNHPELEDAVHSFLPAYTPRRTRTPALATGA